METIAVNVATVTTRTIEDGRYKKQEDGKSLQLAKENLQKRPYLYHVTNINNSLTSTIFLEDSDKIEDEETYNKKVEQLFGIVPEKIILYVHGFNCSASTAKKDATKINDITKVPVVIFDWDSTHHLTAIPQPPIIGKLIPNIHKGYAKDSESATASVRPLNWLMYILLRSVKKVHIISHSMGARIVIGSLNSITHDYRILLRYGSDKKREHPFYAQYTTMLESLETVVFKQPDADIVNMSRFVRHSMKTIYDANNNIKLYIYSHKRDNALGFSQDIHFNIQRVGQLCGAKQLIEVLKDEGSDTLDIQFLRIIDASSCLDDYSWYNIWNKRLSPYANHSYFDCNKFKRNLENIITNNNAANIQTGNIYPI